MGVSSEDLEDCPECAEAEPHPVKIVLRPPLTIDELRAWKDDIERIDSEGVRHSVAELEGEYSVEKWLCSYIEHPHKHGFLVWSRCGKLLALGSDCAEKHLVDYEKFKREIDVAQAVRAQRDLNRELPPLLDHLRDLARQVRARMAGGAALQEHALVVYQAMRKAVARSDPWVYARVPRFDPKTLRNVLVEERQRLDGLMLFASSYSTSEVDHLVERAELFAAEMASGGVDEHNCERVSAERSALIDGRHQVEALLREVGTFWLRDNLVRAFIKAYGRHAPEKLHPEGSTIVVDGPTRVVIGINGVVPPSS